MQRLNQGVGAPTLPHGARGQEAVTSQAQTEHILPQSCREPVAKGSGSLALVFQMCPRKGHAEGPTCQWAMQRSLRPAGSGVRDSPALLGRGFSQPRSLAVGSQCALVQKLLEFLGRLLDSRAGTSGCLPDFPLFSLTHVPFVALVSHRHSFSSSPSHVPPPSPPLPEEGKNSDSHKQNICHSM